MSLINSWYLSRSCTRRKVSYTIFDLFHPLRFDEIFSMYNKKMCKKAKMGVVEGVTSKLVVPFQVLYEREGKVYNN